MINSNKALFIRSKSLIATTKKENKNYVYTCRYAKFAAIYLIFIEGWLKRNYKSLSQIVS